MRPHISVLGSLLLGAVSVLAQSPAPPPPSEQLRLRLNPSGIRDFGDPDYTIWTIDTSKKTESGSWGNVKLTLTAGGGANLYGSSYKLAFARFVPFYGERVVDQGITTKDPAGQNLTLTIQGLSPGNHTLLSYHNSWDALKNGVSSISITVDGKTVAQNQTQSIRVDNIWETAYSYLPLSVTSTDQTITVVYSPGSGNANPQVYLNAIFIDSPPAGDLVAFPEPLHNDDHVELNGATSLTATWKAPALAPKAKYNVYFGTSKDKLTSVSMGQCQTKVEFSNLNTNDIYYWRVDVVSNGTVYGGNTFRFRVAQLAFPGAEGWGRWARGGRGGKVVHVTTLADGDQPGTLRHALVTLREPRIIVFDVGGVITLNSRLAVNGSQITLAGQTAPGKGIAVQGWPIGLTGASDIIFQHVRVRPGKISNQTVDGMGMQGSNHCIFDRISTGWAMDECFSSRSAYNITLQRSFISEPLNVAGHKNYPPGTAHGYAASISGDVGSFHHNLIAHAEGRSWSMAGNVDAEAFFAGRLDLRNNVVYNFGKRVTDGGVHQGVFVGNVYKRGPQSKLEYMLEGTYENQLYGEQTYHCMGNTMWYPNNTVLIAADSPQYPDNANNSWPGHPIACYANIKPEVNNPPPLYRHFYDEPFFPSHITEHPADLSYKIVLSDRGAQSPVLDDHDGRIIVETLTGTALYNGSYTGERGIIDNEADVGGLESFPSVVRDAAWDADGDGVADWWDGSTGGDGYTPIEGYLNWMSETHVFVEPAASVKINLTELVRGFTPPNVFEVKGATKGSVTVEGEVATYKAGEAGIERLTVGVKDAEGSQWSRQLGVAVFAGASKAQ